MLRRGFLCTTVAKAQQAYPFWINLLIILFVIPLADYPIYLYTEHHGNY